MKTDRKPMMYNALYIALNLPLSQGAMNSRLHTEKGTLFAIPFFIRILAIAEPGRPGAG